MGCKSSKQLNGGPNTDESNDLDRQLLMDKIQDLYNFKVLLLGAGESGKSTVVKQLKLIYRQKPTKAEMRTVGDSLHQNVIDCMKALIWACQKFEYAFDEEDQKTADLVLNYDEGNRISLELGESITRLYNSESCKKAKRREDEFWLLDSCGYYMKHLDRFTEIGFIPREEDSVMARIRTTGIVVSELESKLAPNKNNPDQPSHLKLQMVDVGGQRNERRKWIHCFDDVKAILYTVNLAGYNQVLFEDTSKNRMHESLELLGQVSNFDIFKETPIFLFLNKKDLFEQMILKKDLCAVFPEYTGGKNLDTAMQYIKERFLAVMPEYKRTLQDGVHFVTGCVKKDIRDAFTQVEKVLLQLNEPRIEAEVKAIQQEKEQVGKAPGCCSSAQQPY